MPADRTGVLPLRCSKLPRRLYCGVRWTAQVAVCQQDHVCPRRQALPGPGGWLTPPDGAGKPSQHPVHEPDTPVPGNRMVRWQPPLLEGIGKVHHKPLGTYRCLEPESTTYQQDLPTEPPGLTEKPPECGSDTSRRSGLSVAMGGKLHAGASHPGRVITHRGPTVGVAAEHPGPPWSALPLPLAQR